jgi:hypothetical protein
MKSVLAGLAFITLAAGAAQAMPVAPAAGDIAIEQAAWGCGPGRHPTRFGGCEPNRPVYRPMYRPAYRPMYRPGPRCDVRMTPMGPRRFCR